MRRELDKAREEQELISQLREILESRLKLKLPTDLESALNDGVFLCHLANNIRANSVTCIHVPSPTVPKLTVAKCRRNADNFLEACRRLGVPNDLLCSPQDILGEQGGLVRIAITVQELTTQCSKT
ncbi:leucine-rich repeat and calponin homology domain-containing protein 1 [Caerostris darwini]|uniref:Leucine-rich repeat and calponin homology domain-containing protein 1 n=1 Tax=Caerostris darwini TaxID=1538125 RepID=A0AAV4Q8U3_9ARAC|nr:leucine-rich repeat and calponin homology domain-containing protein 1 [Caerostris darwini]